MYSIYIEYFTFKFLLKDKRKALKDKELQMGRNTDLFWEVNMNYLKALLEGP